LKTDSELLPMTDAGSEFQTDGIFYNTLIVYTCNF